MRFLKINKYTEYFVFAFYKTIHMIRMLKARQTKRLDHQLYFNIHILDPDNIYLYCMQRVFFFIEKSVIL